MRNFLRYAGMTVLFLAVSILTTHALTVSGIWAIGKIESAKAAAVDLLPKKEVPQQPKPLMVIIDIAARTNNVDPLILQVIVEKESNNGDTRSLYRFEPDLFSRLRGQSQYRNLSDSEVRMLASSHGAFHILGLTAERECGLHFSKLYNNEIAAHCAAKIVRRIDDNVQAKATSERLKEIFKRYNGQGKAADMYASDAMVRLASLLYKDRAAS